MIYKIEIKKRALKNLRKIPDKFAEKIREIINIELSNNPHQPHPKIKKIFEPIIGYRYKTPPYRIIYQIDEKNKIIFIRKIKHRKDSYKRFGIF